MFNPKDNKDTYKDQNARVVPIAGQYDVVNIRLGFQAVGRGTERLRIVTLVLGVIDSADPKEAKKLLGKTFGQDIWWHKPGKEGNFPEDCDFNLLASDTGSGLGFNGIKLMNMAIAHGNSEDFTEQVKERKLVQLITGVPYRITIDVKEERSNGRVFYTVDTQETKHLPKAQREKYTNDPDFKKKVGEPESREMDYADYSNKDKGDNEEQGSVSSDPFDDDLPF